MLPPNTYAPAYPRPSDWSFICLPRTFRFHFWVAPTWYAGVVRSLIRDPPLDSHWRLRCPPAKGGKAEGASYRSRFAADSFAGAAAFACRTPHRSRTCGRWRASLHERTTAPLFQHMLLLVKLSLIFSMCPFSINFLYKKTLAAGCDRRN